MIPVPHRWPIAIAMLAVVLVSGSASAVADPTAWAALREPGTVAVMRHAEAPGFGDPVAVKLGDCSTQRNLDEAGRRQARAAGDAFRANGISAARIYSSQWCRCLETANLLGLGNVEERAVLNSPFGLDAEVRANRADAFRRFLADLAREGPQSPKTVLVSHHALILSVTGQGPRSGEIFVLRPYPDGKLSLVGRIKP